MSTDGLIEIDPELVDALRDTKRRRAAVESLYALLAGRLKRFFARHGGSAAESEDWCQETFIRILRSVEAYRGGPGEFMPWVWTIARNVARDAFRRGGGRVHVDIDDLEVADVPVDDGADTQGRVEQESVADCVRRAFADFARDHPGRAECLSWLATDRMDIAAVAGVLGRSVAATREYLSQCRKKLRPYLEPCLMGEAVP